MDYLKGDYARSNNYGDGPSGARYVDIKTVKPDGPCYRIPDIGMVCLFYYEADNDDQDKNPGKGLRLIGTVRDINRHGVMFIEWSRFPSGRNEMTSIRIQDIIRGAVLWRELTERVYIGNTYGYEDLDLENLHPDIAKYVKDMENDNVRYIKNDE